MVEEPPAPDTRPPGPIRALRRLALTGELGWNGLAGFGPVLTYHVVPQFSLELGGGLSFTGLKAGLRGRYNLLTGPVTPFIGAGVLGTSGLGVVSGDFSDKKASDSGTSGGDQITIRVRPSTFVQAVGGVDWTSPGGFTLVGAIGWSQLFRRNLDILAGSPTNEDRLGLDIAFGSGPVFTVATGYTFK
ncbi:MAG: hypothetical protein QM756_06800 [Polyangiaceae bacterium]